MSDFASFSSRRLLALLLVVPALVPVCLGAGAASLVACSSDPAPADTSKPNVKPLDPDDDDDRGDDDDDDVPGDKDSGTGGEDGGSDAAAGDGGGSGKACAFNADCPPDERCEGTDTGDFEAFCKTGPRGTGGVGADCKNGGGNACASSVCVEGGSGSTATAYCSDQCDSDTDCKAPLPYCHPSFGLCWYPPK